MGLFSNVNQSLLDARLRFNQKKNVFAAPQQRLGVRKLKTYLEDSPAAKGQGAVDSASGKTLYAKYAGKTKYVSRSSSLAIGGWRQFRADTRHNEKTRFASDLIDSCRWLLQFDDSNELRYAVNCLEKNRDFNDGKFIDTRHFRMPLDKVAAAEERVQQQFEMRIQKMKDTRAALLQMDPDRLKETVGARESDINLAKKLNAVWAKRDDGNAQTSAEALQKFVVRASEGSGMTSIALIEKLLLQKTVSCNLKPEVFDALVHQYKSMTLDCVR